MDDSKIIIRNIFHMLCYAFRILRQQNFADIMTEDFKHIEDMFAAILSRGIASQLKHGLYRTYVEHEEQTKTLRGKLHPYETGRLRALKMQMVDCCYDELSEDNELNRILKASAMKLIGSPEVSVKYKKTLRSEMMFFQNISDIELSSVQWGRLQYHRNNRNYELLMNICRFIRQSLLPSTMAGNNKFTLFDEESMPMLYEKFILEYYRQHFPMLKANDNPIRWDLPEDISSYEISQLPGMHSDIMLRYKGKTLIIDAKFYKHSLLGYMGKQMLHSSNIYQIYAYVKNEDKTHSGNVSGMLLYAKTTEDVIPSMSVPIGGNMISARSLDLDRDFSEIAYTLDMIAKGCFGVELVKVA